MASNELPAMLTARMIRERILPIGRRTMQRYLAARTFPPADMRLGGKTFWKREKVLAWLDAQTEGGEK